MGANRNAPVLTYSGLVKRWSQKRLIHSLDESGAWPHGLLSMYDDDPSIWCKYIFLIPLTQTSHTGMSLSEPNTMASLDMGLGDPFCRMFYRETKRNTAILGLSVLELKAMTSRVSAHAPGPD